MVRDWRVFDFLIFLAIIVLLFLCAPQPGAAQTGPPSAAVASPSQNPFLGSVPTGQATSAPLALSLKDALSRALKYNLGGIEADEETRAAHAARLRSLNSLLPNLSARINSTVEQINLKTLGFSVKIPGINIPTIIGPFGVADARVVLSQQLFNWADIKNLKASHEAEKVSQYTYKNDRDVVVVTSVDAYLLVISDAATVDS